MAVGGPFMASRLTGWASAARPLLAGEVPSYWGCTLLFDPRPKEDPRDLFDREEELKALRSGINYPVTLLLGLRRSGKSSLVKVLMRQEDALWVYLDMRKFEGRAYITYRDLVQELEGAINSWPERLRQAFRGLRGVRLAGVEVRLSWGPGDRAEISDVLERLSEVAEEEGRRPVVVFDESQELRRLKGYDLLYPIAYAYDNLRVRFIFTGSEVGMVYRFLRLNDPGSPLYGRAVTEVNVGPFSRGLSLEFLRRGFEEVGMKVPEAEVEEAYYSLGGIPGWLTYYGFYYMQLRDHREALNKTISTGVELVRQEFRSFLVGREAARERYYTIMEACREGCTWSDVKRALEAREGARVDDKQVTLLIRNLVDASFLTREGDLYRPADVLIRRAFQRQGEREANSSVP